MPDPDVDLDFDGIGLRDGRVSDAKSACTAILTVPVTFAFAFGGAFEGTTGGGIRIDG